MDRPAAIAGTFTKIDAIGTRKVARLSIEIPIEGVNNALDVLGGYPDAVNPVHVAIARLKTETVITETEARSGNGHKRSWSELTYAARAAMRCQEESFRRFAGVENQDQAANFYRKTLGVESRAEILPGTEAAIGFEQIEEDYQEWRRQEWR